MQSTMYFSRLIFSPLIFRLRKYGKLAYIAPCKVVVLSIYIAGHKGISVVQVCMVFNEPLFHSTGDLDQMCCK